MLTIESLKAYGADTDTGLARCVNKEALYLRLVKMIPNNEGFQKLKEAVGNHDLDAAFEAAHGLKGVTSNLALTPLSSPIIEITEILRNRVETDFNPLLEKIEKARKELETLCQD